MITPNILGNIRTANPLPRCCRWGAAHRSNSILMLFFQLFGSLFPFRHKTENIFGGRLG